MEIEGLERREEPLSQKSHVSGEGTGTGTAQFCGNLPTGDLGAPPGESLSVWSLFSKNVGERQGHRISPEGDPGE